MTEYNQLSTTQKAIARECDDLKELLLKKNAAYGDSAVNPVRIFSRVDAEEQIRVRIDDKISRLVRGQATHEVPEDTEQDLLGYLILLRVARRLKKMSETRSGESLLSQIGSVCDSRP